MTNLSAFASVMVLVILMLGQSRSNKICCTQYDNVRVPIKELKYYVVQDITQFCDIRAIIFQTGINKPVCADPERKWVKNAIVHVPHFDQWKRNIQRQ